ncbi:MAG: ATP-dependent metallopeptidase FtsH/Yme1/Tma family protein, partial [Pseudomonadota bacterium]|nr:ATP-dependent metallopeptidase FtsH/Yme1/Tma family protein [Pseudomonadota bacterium]
MNNTRNLIVWVVVGLLLVSLFNFFQKSPTSSNAREINFSQFVAEVEAGNVEEVVISGDSITG